ncbi:MAG: DNA helicase [Tannerellaceae bacterium]|nr:DNA helicase [Tannerellaceae bacterium]
MENVPLTTCHELSLNTLEKAVVSGLLACPNSLPDVAGWLQPEMFHHADVAFIYRAIRNLYDRGIRPDYLLTENEMRQMDSQQTDRIGGIALLEKMLVHVRPETNIPRYATEVRRQFLLRKLHEQCRLVGEKALLAESDPLELAGEMDRELLGLRELGQDSHQLQQAETLAVKAFNAHMDKREKGASLSCVKSGFKELDAIFGGMHNGELFVVGGRPGEGKTAVALHLAAYAALKGKHTCFFSLEMTYQQLMDRLFTGYAGVDPGRLRKSMLTDQDVEKMRTFLTHWKDVPLYIDFTPANSLENIRASVLLRRRQGKCDFALIDYVQLMRTFRIKNDTEDQYIGRIVTGLKALALEADIPILLLSQMNRDSERRHEKQHMPILSDLRSSGVIEQAADGVFFVYNPSKNGMEYDPKTKESYEDVLLLLVRKNRNGTYGTARIRHNKSFTFFTDYDNTIF